MEASTAFLGRVNVKKIREPDGSDRMRAYSRAEVDAWADEAVLSAARMIQQGKDFPPMLMFVWSADGGPLMHGGFSLAPYLRAKKRGVAAVEAIAPALARLHAFAMIRIEPTRISPPASEMLASFETLSRVWTRVYRVEQTRLVVIANEPEVRSANGFGAMINTADVN